MVNGSLIQVFPYSRCLLSINHQQPSLTIMTSSEHRTIHRFTMTINDRLTNQRQPSLNSVTNHHLSSTQPSTINNESSMFQLTLNQNPNHHWTITQPLFHDNLTVINHQLTTTSPLLNHYLINDLINHYKPYYLTIHLTIINHSFNHQPLLFHHLKQSPVKFRQSARRWVRRAHPSAPPAAPGGSPENAGASASSTATAPVVIRGND